jgi:hypothetical protein
MLKIGAMAPREPPELIFRPFSLSRLPTFYHYFRTLTQTFVCKSCNMLVKAESGPKALDMGNDTKLEWAGKFCYISEVINADGETHSAVVVQISAWWKMFTRLVPFR